MDIVYIDEQSLTEQQRHAGPKARSDVSSILESMGFRSFCLSYDDAARGAERGLQKIAGHWSTYRDWVHVLEGLSCDVLVLQFPVSAHSIFLRHALARLKACGTHIILIIHDLDYIRYQTAGGASRESRGLRITLEEISILKLADVIISHNARMTECLREVCTKEVHIVELGLFDYLIAKCGDAAGEIGPDQPIVVAGNLDPRKAGYVYGLDSSLPVNLYGVNAALDRLPDACQYQGQFAPEDLPQVINGSYGLVWDGPSVKTCSGQFGEYLRRNCPHKASLYAVSMLPLIVWSESALAPYVLSEEIGLAVESLAEVGQVVMDNRSRYEHMQQKLMPLSEDLASGQHLRRAMELALRHLQSAHSTVG